MSKQEYMRQLKERLKRLPKEDFERAVAYFEEYFAEAGEENEAKAAQDLGSPQEAADQIIRDMALNYSKEPVQNVRKGLNGLWVAVLALFAVPVAMPLLLTGAILVLVAVIVVWTLFLALFIAAVCAVIAGPLTIVAGFSVITKSFAVFLTCVGIGFMAMGIGAACVYATYLLCRRFMGWTLHKLAVMISKGRKKNA
ncbi:hypothetical protein C823_001419 [Eubacterium plexicaudatum ASF492]|uniref:DUF1700 domain-containing protein n=1 Tax=Eubacterium plexicaudatum ASF492 TaxID=1235802 RepID=N2BDT0_9FIRM|nr:hypothetical protein C823_001419 [Eubacterium plexicaudatum ASF492]